MRRLNCFIGILYCACVLTGCCCLGPTVRFPDKWQALTENEEESLEINAVSGRAWVKWSAHVDPAKKDPVSGDVFIDGSPYLLSMGRLLIQRNTDLILLSESSGEETFHFGNVISSSSLMVVENKGEVTVKTLVGYYVLSPSGAKGYQYEDNCLFSQERWVCVKPHWGFARRVSLVVKNSQRDKVLWEGPLTPEPIVFDILDGKVIYLFTDLRTPDGFANKKGFINYGKLVLQAYDLDSGNQLWEIPLSPASELHTEFWSGDLQTPEGAVFVTQYLPTQQSIIITQSALNKISPDTFSMGWTYSIDPGKGTILWQTQGKAWLRIEDAYSSNSVVFLFRPDDSNHLYSLNPSTGRILQRYDIEGAPAFLWYPDTKLFIGDKTILYINQTSEGKQLIALDIKTGKHLWSKDFHIQRVFPVFGDDTVIVGDPRDRVVTGGKARFFSTINFAPDALTAYDERTGTPRWTAKVMGGKYPRIVSVSARGNRAFIRTASGELYAIRWEY